jgi:hypothetical protein
LTSYPLFSESCLIDSRRSLAHSPAIHILDDDSLLNIFSLCRPVILNESEANDTQILTGGEWNREQWWYGLVQVCRRWRYLVLESASYLRLSLVCTQGTPVASMLAHSPSLPLIIDYLDPNHDITSEEEEGIILALHQHDRVRRIRLRKPIPILQKLIKALDSEFPILEFLLIEHQQSLRPRSEHNPKLKLPETFRVPHLRHFMLMSFDISIESPLLTIMGNLVVLSLSAIPSSAYFQPSALLQRLSLMPQLEKLGIGFDTYSNRDIEQHLLHTPITTDITLPNLRWLAFQGTSAYLEAVLCRVTIPLLEILQLYFFNRLMYSIPHLQQIMSAAKNLRFKTATFYFRRDHLNVMAYPHKGAKMYALNMELGGRHLDWQVVSAGQVFSALRKVFSSVDDLTLESDRHGVSSEWNNVAGRIHWREFLGLFGNVKILRVNSGLIDQLSRALQPAEGESSAELLPELQELTYSGSSDTGDAFTSFTGARQNEGSPITLTRH